MTFNVGDPGHVIEHNRIAELHASTFGAVGDGVADDTGALQSALNAAQETGAAVRLDAGTYLVSTLVTAQSFTQPSLVGAGFKATTITCAGPGPIMSMTGGSGELCGVVVSDLTFTGSTATGIELNGVCGVTVERVRFQDLAVGLLFHNRGSGAFTEFCIANRCVFDSTTPTHIEYRKGASGDASFHGSGFTECVFVQDAAASAPIIKIGDGTIVYNSPFTGTIFAASTEPLIHNATSAGTEVTAYGTLTIEPSSSSLGAVVASGGGVLLVGGVLGLVGYECGTLTLVSKANKNGDGTTSFLEVARTEVYDLTTGANNTSTFVDPGTFLVNVYVTAANYDYDHTLVVYADRYGTTGAVTELSNNKAFNAAAYGAPAFSFATSRLVITNGSYPASGVTAVVTVTQIGGRPTSPLL